MNLGCTGHQTIPTAAVDYVTRGIREAIEVHDASGLVGVCSLAIGADQVFARLVLAHGGRLHVVIPCVGYERTFDDGTPLQEFRSLLERASTVDVLDYPEPSESAYLAAGYRVMELADRLVAVWDGRPAQGKGGTGDVVQYARERGVETLVVWPPGIER